MTLPSFLGPAFTCDTGEEFSESAKCDGYPDCPNGEDERDCPSASEIVVSDPVESGIVEESFDSGNTYYGTGTYLQLCML